MRLMRFDEASVAGLEKKLRLKDIWVAVDSKGNVSREIGFDSKGRVVHKYPGTGRFGCYGVFDSAVIEHRGEGELSQVEFEEAWATGLVSPEFNEEEITVQSGEVRTSPPD